MANVKKLPLYQDMDGLLIPKMFSPDCYWSALKYKPRDDDVFIATYPKCGTTWTQHILLYLFRKGQPMKEQSEYFVSCPFIEMLGIEAVENMPRPNAIKTHLPFHLTPYSPKTKYIYVARNPKDCCVSLFHHERMFPGYGFGDGNFDDFFELFIRGEVEWGDYFDHHLGWYEHRDDPNVLFVTYEDMKKDTRAAVMQMAKFLGPEYGEMLEKDPTVMDNVLRYSSLKYMKENFNDVFAVFDGTDAEEKLKNPLLPEGAKYMVKFCANQMQHGSHPKFEFVRKGIVGDWRNHISPEQSKRLDERFTHKTRGTGLADLWKDEMKLWLRIG